MYKIISKIFFYVIAGLFFLFSNVTLGQTATENYTKSITYLTETLDGNVSEEERIESIVYYDGLNRPKQSIAQRAGGNKEDLVTPIFYDQYGRQSIEYLPLPIENNNGNYYNGTNGNISGEIKSFYKQKFPDDFYSPPGLHPDWDNPYTEKIFENSPISKVVEYASPGYDWRNTGAGDHTKKIEYTTNDLNEVKKFSIVYESGTPTLQENGYYSDGEFHELIKTIKKDENWTAGKLNTTETFTDKNGRVILTNSFVTNGGNIQTLPTYFVYDDLGRLIFKIPPKLDGNYNSPSTYDDIQISWSIHDFISPYNSALEGDVYFSIENDILNMGGTFGQNSSGILATLNLQTTKPLNTNPALPDMYLGKLIGIKPPPSNESFHLGDINIINGNLVINRVSNENFLGMIFSPLTINVELVTNSINKLAFQYRYDNQNRLISQKSPGKGWEEIVYDRYDRPIMTRDALLKERGKWMFKKYDGFGRVAYTGVINSNHSRSFLQNEVNNKTTNPGQSENRLVTPYTVAGTPIYYTNGVFPKEDILEIRTVHYYDDYIDHLGVSVPSSVFNVSTQVNTKSLPTVSRVRVLNTDDWIVTITGYDKNARAIYVASKNEYLQTTDIVKNKINFSGEIIESITTHSKAGNATITTQDLYSYDHIGRPKTHQQRVDNEPPQLISHNSYDDIGQLLDKKVGGELFKNGYTNIVNVAVNAAGLISKTDSSDSWNAGLATIGKLEGNGGLSFIVPNQLGSFMRIGLRDVNTNPGSGEMDFYYYFYKNSNNDPIVTSYARNLQSGSIITLSTSTYQTNDAFSIEWVGDEIKYIQNGNIIDTFQLVAAPSFLIGDLSFKSPNSKIRDLDFYAAGEINKYLQDVDYKYNVRGWLTDINNVAGASTILNNDLFNFKINYNEAITGNAGEPGKAIPLYDGTISQTMWRSKNTDTQLRSYAYKYDELNRILIAYSKIGNDLNETDDHTLWGMSYDKNGNILSLRRSGKYVSQYWDQLVYNYDGNRLVGVEDISTCNCKDKGFDDVNNSDQDYLYDINGNLVSDANKHIANIAYNDLNLPEYILVDNYGIGGTITYVYDATGKKLQKTYVESGVNGSPIITQYAGNYVYEKNQNGPNVLQFIGQPEGYIIPTPVIPPGVGEETKSVTGFDTGTGQTTYSTYSYVFQYRDHLGNIRLSYSDINKNGNIEFGDEIIEESNYYPFGIKQWGYNDYSTGAGNAIAQQYKFGGKQLQEELGIGWYDFGSRNYDAAIGRWMNPDPQNQFASPYLYGFNNPVSSIDPDGEWAWIPIVVGAIIGGASTAIANPNADFGDIMFGAAIGAVSGAVTAGIGSAITGAATTTVTTTVTSTGVAVTGTATASLSTTAQILVSAGAHGFFQGTMASVVSGGSFWKGAAIGAGSSVAGSLTQSYGPLVQISAGGVTGGVTSAIQGEDFTQGFATGLIVSGLNHALHKIMLRSKLRNKLIDNNVDPDGIPAMTKEAAMEMTCAIPELEEQYILGGRPSVDLDLRQLPPADAFYDSGTRGITLFKNSFRNNLKLTATLFHEYTHAFHYYIGYDRYVEKHIGPIGTHTEFGYIRQKGWYYLEMLAARATWKFGDPGSHNEYINYKNIYEKR